MVIDGHDILPRWQIIVSIFSMDSSSDTDPVACALRTKCYALNRGNRGNTRDQAARLDPASSTLASNQQISRADQELLKSHMCVQETVGFWTGDLVRLTTSYRDGASPQLVRDRVASRASGAPCVEGRASIGEGVGGR
jgi:hypothetical protein